jgi:hypothetical protein
VQAITDAVTAGNSQSFGYDSLQRLSTASGGYGGFGFTYDGDGNQLSQTAGATTTNYGYGSGSDLLATISVGGVQTQAVGYTADGRIFSLSPGIQAPGGQYITSLSYNQDARLSAVNAGSGALASYTYDGFGQRLIKNGLWFLWRDLSIRSKWHAAGRDECLRCGAGRLHLSQRPTRGGAEWLDDLFPAR